MLTRAVSALLFTLLSATTLHSQQRPAFDVATVRPSQGDPNDGYWSLPNTGVFTAHNLTLEWLIRLAYDVDPNQILNKPPWLETATFDVAARPADGVILTRKELRPRLQALLAERFHLTTHNETRPTPGYALVVAKGGPKLQPTRGARFPNFRQATTDTELSGLNWSTAFLAASLQHAAGRPVADHTGLTGSYDIDLHFAPSSPSADTSLPSVFTAVRETLGLELKPRSIPVQFLVIDHLDRTPTEN